MERVREGDWFVAGEVESDQVEMEEDARLNHLAGRETIKKTPLGRATTRAVDQTGKNRGERIQTLQSHLTHHQLVETGVAGMLILRKKPMLVEAGVLTPRTKPVLVETGVVTQRKKPMLLMVTNQAMKTKQQQLGEPPLTIRRMQETTMMVGAKSQVMMLKRVEQLITHGEAKQTQEHRHQVALRGEPEPKKNPDGNKKSWSDL